MIPAGSIPWPLRVISVRSSSNVSRIRASMIRHSSSRLTVRPASSPRPETRSARRSTLAQVAGAMPDLELLGDLDRRLDADRHVVGHVAAADRQHGRVERRPVREQREVDRARADVRDRDPQLLLGLGQHRLCRREPVRDELVDLDAGELDALGQVLDRGRRGGDDVRLDLEPQRAHPERVLDALLAVDGEAATLDVEHVPVRRDGDRAGDLDRAVDVLAGDLAVVRGDRDLPGGVEALDVLPADADEGTVDLPAREPLRALDGVRDRPDRLVDVDHDALLEAGRRHGPVAHDRQAPVPADLADERTDLRRADVDADQDRFPFHLPVVPRLFGAADPPHPR